MSNTVDNRVVEMQFDNKDFEKNVATSMNTIDKLKKSLDFSDSGKSLDGLQRSVDSFSMAGIQESLSAIQYRFSAMGIAGMTVIQNLTNSALGMLTNIGYRIKDMIVSGGISRAMNIENAKFQLEGLKIKYEDVFDAIDYAVTNTAYSLDAAASAASQLATSGLDYKNVIFTHQTDQKELTKMSMALRAVSGVAAQTQSDYATVARYFQDVANAGRVTGGVLSDMTQVLNLPVEQNLAEGLKAIADGSYEASEATQKAVKSLVKNAELSAEDVKKYASKGLISFDMFSTIMFNKYADHAVDANRTIMGVMSNIRSAFAKIGAEFVSPIIEIDGIVVKMLDSIRAKVNEIKPMVIPFAKELADSIKILVTYIKVGIDGIDLTWLKPFFQGLGDIVRGLANNLVTVGAAFRTIFPKESTDRLKNFGEAVKDFGKNFLEQSKSAEFMQTLSHRFQGLFALLSAGKTILQTLLSPFKGFIEGLKESAGLGGEVFDSFADWAKGIDKMLKESEKLKEVSAKLFDAGKEVGSSLKVLVGDIVNVFKTIKQGPEAVLTEVFDGFVRDIVNSIIRIIEIFTGKDLSFASEAFNTFIDNVKTAIHEFSEILASGEGNLSNFIDKIKSIFTKDSTQPKSFRKMVESMGEEESTLKKVTNSLMSILTGFVTFLDSTLTFIFDIGSGVFAGLTKLFDGIKELFTSENKNKTDPFKTIEIGAILYVIKDIIKSIADLVGNSKKSTNALKTFVSTTTDTIDGMKLKPDKYKQFLEIAVALILIAKAADMIAKLDIAQVGTAMGAITALVAELFVFAKFTDTNISAPMEAIKQLTTGGLLIELALGILILANAAQKFAEITNGETGWENLGKVGAAIGGLLLSLWLFAKFTDTSVNNPLEIIKQLSTGLFLIMLAEAISMLADSAKKFIDMSQGTGGWENLGKAGAAIAGLMTILVAFLHAVPNKDMIKTGIGLYALAKSVSIFAEAAVIFADLRWEELGKAAAAMTGILAGLAIFVRLSSNVDSIMFEGKSGDKSKTSRQTKNMIEMGIGMIAMAAAMKLFASAAKDFSRLSWPDLAQAGVAIGGIILALSLFSKFTVGSNLVTLAASLVIFAVAMNVLVPAISGLAQIPFLALVTSLGAVIVILAILGGAAKLMEGIVPAMEKLSLTLLIFGAAMIAIGLGLAAIAMGATKALQALPSVLEVVKQLILGLIDLVIASASKIADAIMELLVNVLASLTTRIPEIADLLITMLVKIIEVVTTRLPEIAEAVKKMVDELVNIFGADLGAMDMTAFITAIAGITIFLVALAACAFIVQKAMLGVVGIIAVMGIVTAMFLILSSIEADKILAITEGLAVTFLSLSVVMGILALVGSALPAVLLGIVGLAAVVAGLVAIIAALGGLAQIPGFEWLMGEGTRVVGEIGNAIGTFVGSIVGGFGVALTDSLPQIADNLSEFILHLTPFIMGMKMIDDDVLVAALALAGVIVALTAADILQGLTSWLTGGASFADFGDQLAEFAPGLKAFYEEVKDVKPDVIKAAAEASLALAKVMNALPKEGGVVGWFMGETDMSKLCAGLRTFGRALVDYAAIVKDLDSAAVTKSAEAAEAVSALANGLPNSGGWLGKIMGENDMEDFASQLPYFATKMVQYSHIVRDLDDLAVAKSTVAAQCLAVLADNLPNSGGFLADITGDNDMKSFGEDLYYFGWYLKKFAEQVSGIEEGAFNPSIEAGKALASLAASLPNNGGAVSIFTGNNDMESFGESLVQFGESMKEYSDTIKGVAFAENENIIEASNKLITLSNNMAGFNAIAMGTFEKGVKELIEMFLELPNSGGLISKVTGDNDVGEFGKKLASFAWYLMVYAQRIDAINEDSINKSVNIINSLVSAVNMFSSGGLFSIFTGKSDFKTLGKQLMDFAEVLGKFSEAMTIQDTFEGGIDFSIIDQISNGVTALADLATKISTIDVDMMATFAESSKSFIEKFGTVGKNYAKKFGDQLTSQEATSYVDSAILSFVNVMMASFTSKEADFYSKAVYLVGKFISGLKSKVGGVKSAAKELGEAAVKTLATFESRFYQIGVNCIDGVTRGLTDKDAIIRLANKMHEIAGVLVESITKPLGIQSPSKKFAEIGGFAIEGFVIGLNDGIGSVEESANRVASAALDTMQSAIDAVRDSVDADMDITPIITPVVDLTDVNANASRINDLFNRSIGVSNVRAAIIPKNLNDITNLQNAQYDLNNPNNPNASKFGTTFIQNNYSPKALNRMEIYRQTRNQFSQYREAML